MQYKLHELAVLKCSFGSLFVYYICFIVFLDHLIPGVSILTSYGENPHYVKLPIFSDLWKTQPNL